MTKKNLSTMTLAMILVLAMAGFAAAGPGYGRGGCGGQAGPQGWYGQLTPEKQAAVEKIFESYRPRFDEVRVDLQAKHNVLQAMINGGQADEKKITQLTKDISNLRNKMFDLRQSLDDELVKETGIETARLGRGFGPGQGRNFDCGGPGNGPGNGQGRSMNGDRPCWQ